MSSTKVVASVTLGLSAMLLLGACAGSPDTITSSTAGKLTPSIASPSRKKAADAPTDNGAQSEAKGIPVFKAGKHIWQYESAPGDTLAGIQKRFDLDGWQIENDNGQPLASNVTLREDDVIQFVPTNATVQPKSSSTTPRDSGPATQATGQVTSNASGIPTQYTVASGDIPQAICARLGIGWWQLEDSQGQELGFYPTIYPGQIIYLSADAAYPLPFTDAEDIPQN